jgi:hypothetical protein
MKFLYEITLSSLIRKNFILRTFTCNFEFMRFIVHTKDLTRLHVNYITFEMVLYKMKTFHSTGMTCDAFLNFNKSVSSFIGVIYRVLSWKIFQTLSLLTFCIYLVHLPLITARTLMTRVPVYFDGVNAVS